MTKKRYEILDSLPTYGPMYVPVSNNGKPFYSEGFVVQFYKSDGSTWVANFQPGWTDLDSILELENSQNILVIAYGIGYLMNPDNTNPLEVFGLDYSKVLKAPNNRYILQGNTDLTIIEPDGNYWVTERISWDGIEDIEIDNNTIRGLSYFPTHSEEEWVKFSYNIETKILEGGSYQHAEPINNETKKPWWKMW